MASQQTQSPAPKLDILPNEILVEVFNQLIDSTPAHKSEMLKPSHYTVNKKISEAYMQAFFGNRALTMTLEIVEPRDNHDDERFRQKMRCRLVKANLTCEGTFLWLPSYFMFTKELKIYPYVDFQSAAMAVAVKIEHIIERCDVLKKMVVEVDGDPKCNDCGNSTTRAVSLLQNLIKTRTAIISSGVEVIVIDKSPTARCRLCKYQALSKDPNAIYISY